MKISNPGLSTVLQLTLALLLLAPAIGSWGSEDPTSQGSSLEAFQALYAQVTRAVAEDALAASAGAAAEDLRFALETDLIRRDAEIEVGKLEVARYSGARQQQALDRLLAAAAARERRVCVAIRQLERLAGISAELSAVPAPAETASADATEPPAAKGEEGELSFKFEAEDLINDPDS